MAEVTRIRERSEIDPKYTWNAADIFPTEIVMTNGNAVLNNKGIASLAAWTGRDSKNNTDRPDNYVETKDVSLKFVGVNFSVKGNATSLVAYSKDGNTPNATAYARVSYENCVFDLTSAKKTVTLFDTGNGLIHTSVTVLGCEVKAASLDKLALIANTDATGSVTLDKGANGKLIAITLDKSAAAPTGKYATTLGECEFMKESENALTVTYRLRASALAEFKVQTNISLYSDLRFNIYVTDIATLKSLTLNGEVYDGEKLSSLPKTEIDGASYYILTVALPAGAALDDIILGVEITSGDDVLSGRYTMGVVSYVEAAMAKVGAGAEKTLLCDILSYVRSAYAYAGKTDAKIAKIDAILGADYDAANMPTVSTAVTPEVGNGVESATFVLGAVPSVRFYLDGTVSDVTKFKFTGGGRTLAFTTGSDSEGDYVEVATYAYVLADEISFTVEGTSYSGSYNLASYYDYAQNRYEGAKKAELINLTERFMRYAESAKAYKAAAAQ